MSNGTVHPHDPKMAKEHEALLNLVPAAAATHVAVNNGSWFNPSTWRGGVIPGNNAKVLIPQGVNVVYDAESNARLFTLRVDGGLDFAPDRNTKMVIDTFVVAPDGTLTIGTEARPIQGDKTVRLIIADNGPINKTWDPEQLSRGIISHGSVQIHGQEKTSHVAVAQAPMAGARELVLSETPKNWKVGDTLVLTGTRYVPDRFVNGRSSWAGTQDEELKITAINGNRITLDRALKYNHDTPQTDLKAYVANYSRNIVVETENFAQIPNNQRGHTMFMHAHDVDIRYAQFFELGRTDKSKLLDDFKLNSAGNRILDSAGEPIPGARTNIRGRYALHFHRTGVTEADHPAIAVGNAVWGSPGWGYVHHESNLILEQNAAYDVFGSAFVSESGNEIGAWRNNIAIKSEGMRSISKTGERVKNHDVAHNGTGFWFQGRLIASENNIAAGHRNSGITYLLRGVDQQQALTSNLKFPELARYNAMLDPNIPQIQTFTDNEVFASKMGLEVIKARPHQGHDVRSVIDGFKAWDVYNGIDLQYTSKYTLKDISLIASKTSQNMGLIFDKTTEDMVLNNATINGFKVGINLDKTSTAGTLENWHFVFIDTKLTNNGLNIRNFDPRTDIVMSSADLKRGRLNLALGANADMVLYPGATDRKAVIRGTKTDSIGSIEYLSGNDSAIYDMNSVRGLLSKGYYVDKNGTKFLVVEELISDRATGEVREIKYPITIDKSWTNTMVGGVLGKAPNLGSYQLKPDVYLGLDDGSGSVSRETTANKLTTTVSGATWNSSTPDGSRASLSFDGVNDGVVIPDSPLINAGGTTTNRTISLWFNPRSKDTGRQVLYEEGGSTRGLNIYLDQGKLYVGAWNQGTSNNWNGTWLQTQGITNGQWQHVTLVLENSTGNGWVTAYLNGKPFSGDQATGLGAPVEVHADNIGLGATQETTRFHDNTTGTNSQHFAGLIDNLQIYNTALQPFEVGMVFDRYKPAQTGTVQKTASGTQTGSIAALSTTEPTLSSSGFAVTLQGEQQIGEMGDDSFALTPTFRRTRSGESTQNNKGRSNLKPSKLLSKQSQQGGHDMDSEEFMERLDRSVLQERWADIDLNRSARKPHREQTCCPELVEHPMAHADHKQKQVKFPGAEFCSGDGASTRKGSPLLPGDHTFGATDSSVKGDQPFHTLTHPLSTGV